LPDLTDLETGGVELAGDHWAFFSGGQPGATIDTENAGTG
jgi:hypothetical protein